MKKTLTIVALLATFLLLAALAGAVWVKTRPAKSYADMDAFSAAWKACPEEDRHEMLDWLLGQEPARYTTYQVDMSHLAGMDREEVIRYLGPGSWDGESYYVGTIEDDFLGNLFVPKSDWLNLDYDNNDVVSHIETSS